MCNLSVSKVEKINPKLIHEVLTSNKITQDEKIQFIRKHSSEIKSTFDIVPTSAEYDKMMEEQQQAMGKEKGIETIEGDNVYWRTSSKNITPNLGKDMPFRKFNINIEYNFSFQTLE